LPHIGKRFRKTAAAVSAVAALGLGIFTSLGPATGLASSHREAPLVSQDPAVDSTDLYAFVSPDKPDTVTLISNWIPFESPSGGPNFFKFQDGVHYDVNIDNNGDAKPDIVYRWTFASHYRNPKTFLYNLGPVNKLDDANLNFFQTYDLDAITASGTTSLLKDAIVAPSNVGAASMPDYKSLRDQAIVDIEGDGQSFVGQVDDPFFLDLRVFDLLYGTNLKEAGNDSLAGFNVHTMALQVPKSELAADGDATKNPIIGVWTTAERQTISPTGKGVGKYVQIGRLGNPLVNEVVVPVGAKDLFNRSKPADDAQFLAGVTDPELPKLIEAVYKIKAPATPRDDLVSVFLTGVDGLTKPASVVPSEQLRLNMSIAPTASPNMLGVIGGDKAGFPNGRRLQDDVIDIALQVVEGELVGSPNDLGDGVSKNDVAFESAFPYLALPHSGSETTALGTTAAQPAPTAQPTGTATAAPASSKDVSSGTATAIAVAAGIGGLLIGGGIAMAMIRRRRVNGTHTGSSDRTMADSRS
jgi:Domain of unknown function (DUF4331)